MLNSLDEIYADLNKFFKENPEAESLIITNITKGKAAKEYCLELSQSVITIALKDSLKKDTVTFDFKEQAFFQDNQKLDDAFSQSYLTTFEAIYSDLAKNKADLLINHRDSLANAKESTEKKTTEEQVQVSNQKEQAAALGALKAANAYFYLKIKPVTLKEGVKL